MKRLIGTAIAVMLLTGVAQASELPIAATMPYPKIEMVTSHGRMVFELDRPRAPITVENFIRYVLDGHYNGTIFHRSVPEFVIQGGGYLPDFSERETRGNIVNESGNGLSNARGTLAMARHSDPHTATAQWYINLVDNERLDPSPRRWGYTVFGRMIEGEAVMDRIGAIDTGPAGPFEAEVPVEQVTIQHIRLIEEIEE